MKLDYASATQTPSTATGANILSTLKGMSDQDRAALLRMISEQYSIPSHASTPQGQGVAAATATPKPRIKRRAVFTPQQSLKRRARARASSSANHEEEAPAPSGLETPAAAASNVAAQDKQTELEPVLFAAENHTFPEYAQRAAGEMIVNSGRPRYYNWLVESWKCNPRHGWLVIPFQPSFGHKVGLDVTGNTRLRYLVHIRCRTRLGRSRNGLFRNDRE